MSRKPPCRYFQTSGGCRAGAQCTFAHDKASTSTAGSPQSSPSRHRSSTPTSPSSNASVPPGACRTFWTTGSCRFEFQCRFRHVNPNSNEPGGMGSPTRQTNLNLANPATREMVAPFLTESGLAKLNGVATDGFFSDVPTTSLSPSEAQSRLRRFMVDGFRYRHTYDIYAFLVPLCSASTNNKSWTPEEGQLLLGSLTSSNGSFRIAEILNWSLVSLHVGQSRDVLSFQRGILPLLRYFSSEFVVKSTLTTQANHLYNIVLQNLPKLADTIESCLEKAIETRSFKDTSSPNNTSLDLQIFSSIAGVLHELLTRFKNASASHPRLSTLVRNLQRWFHEWHNGVTATPPAFDNPLKDMQPTVRDLFLASMTDKIDRLAAIVAREEEKLFKPNKRQEKANRVKGGPEHHEALVAALHTAYEGPGDLRRPEEPRHDNDRQDISDIRIAPTNDELMCRLPPYLPANFFSAPHHAPESSMQRLLDIQFRLLREELIAPLRKAVQLVQDDLTSPRLDRTKLAVLLKNKGGKYNGMVDSQNSLLFNVYTGVEFTSIVPDWKGMSTSIILDTPPGRARNDKSKDRVFFWESMSGKRLTQGGLIAFIWQSGPSAPVSVYLGIVANSSKEITDYVKDDKEHVKLRIVFFDTEVELRALQELGRQYRSAGGAIKLLVESPVLFESIRPFLEALKSEPEDIPFSRYLVHQPPEILRSAVIDPPRYARLPNFTYQLASLFPPEAEVNDLRLSVADPRSVEQARRALEHSRLDPSQADAVLDVLTREVALIQGPPGTGKSYTGVEIIRVLLANGIGPILMIAFTNHALDHMLSAVLDANITKKIVRLGRRSNDERVAEYSIETLEMAKNHSRLDRAFTSRRELKDVQDHINNLMKSVLNTNLENESEEILKYLSTSYPEHYEHFMYPPAGIKTLQKLTHPDDDEQGAFQTVGRNNKTLVEDRSPYAFWKGYKDLDLIRSMLPSATTTTSQSKATSSGMAPRRQAPTLNPFALLTDATVSEPEEDFSDFHSETVSAPIDDSQDVGVEEIWKTFQHQPPMDEESPEENVISGPQLRPGKRTNSAIEPEKDNTALLSTDFRDVDGFFRSLGFLKTPHIPSTNRDLELLLDDGHIWSMSGVERQKIHQFWVQETRKELAITHKDEFERLRSLHAVKLKETNEMKDEVRRNLLQKMDIIGCTTTGAAQVTGLLKNLSPKVLLVEEAGQVMEAHILGTLVPSIEHIILIGDPLQLRPTLNNYTLSMDSSRGRVLYKFDMSLMERLSTSGLPMSVINVQRRMRPTVSSLIRNTLYPTLEDHPLVKEYPNVRGMQHNVFFLTHSHKENNGADDTASKFNTYEVAMITDLVLYLLRQGCYSNEGDIVVLCAYLGQLARLRDALASQVAVVIDERDQTALDDQESESGQGQGQPNVERVSVSKRVRLRTVDNYQGEEGRIVILSLVRNAGGIEDDMNADNMTSIVRPTIGFLKSVNRTNVALSRAKEGLYILGNAPILSSKSEMWRSVIEELEAQQLVGPGFPVRCHQHPDTENLVSKPGELPGIAPDGGCLQPCGTRLACGHDCSFKCHCDDPKHLSVICMEPCRRLCIRGHPCRKTCSDDCGLCVFPIASVTLPCGHVKSSVPCHKMEMLSDVFCDFQLSKKLPNCEHQTVMDCGADPSTHICSERCGVTMKCCGKDCNASCHECQGSNVRSPATGRILRTVHKRHPCEKLIHCGHRCQQPCSEEHEHTTKCMQQCRQSCVHAQCRLPCSVPCAPCQKPCPWKCAHRTCPVPCGSICIRLPCDLPCTETLKCGHKCPSVCGEDCKKQICPKCAPAEKKSQVVDMILSRTLADVNPESGDLDELLITIPSCKHVFTVETLDGLTGIRDFYTRDDQDTKWTGLKTADGFIAPPSCPLCRSPISSNRYGRIVKRADLDILERNVARHMFQSLESCSDAIRKFDEAKAENVLRTEASQLSLQAQKKPSLPVDLKKLKTNKQAILEHIKETPVSANDIRAGNSSLHIIDSAISSAWQRATGSLFRIYGDIVKLAETRSAHTQAWEASFSYLYEQELGLGSADPAKMPNRPEEHAMRMATLQVGQPRPLADRRTLVEAFWRSLNVRLTLVKLGGTFLDALPSGTSLDHLRQWADYMSFLLSTCAKDAQKTLKVATESKAHRQIVKSVVLRMRVDLETFRFNLAMCKKFGPFKEQRVRDDLREKAAAKAEEETAVRRETAALYFANKGTSAEELDWVKDNFAKIANVIILEWKEIEKSIRMDTFYEPVTLKEKEEIVKAFGFGTTGHFYTCPNGHIFAITECGGAMQRSTCPECGEVIGGSSHHLESTNRVAHDMDEVAQRLAPGIQRSPWANPY
ncbi:P-loop containing nucleoside triphosphate hydrolase protein [Agrocybe pediades]|nr:P-loop containing nucleoside triphosphate hydrolase protein [Agrocybe pediades]